MDNPSGAANNDITQQLSSMSAPIVSTLTTATPITSEIVSDFEPDPKFEITPLEMASYDLYPTNLLDEDNQQSVVANNHGQIHEEPQQAALNVDSQQTQSIVSSSPRGQPSSVYPTEVKQDHSTVGSNSEIDRNQRKNDCEHESQRRDHVNQATHQIQKAQDALTNLLSHSNEGSNQVVDNQKSPNKLNTNESIPNQPELSFGTISNTAGQASGNADASNLYTMTQTAVDDQMEKVIDNIVELGGVHQFPQGLGQPEGKEELLASIHREITSERSSIDLIADVASQQQSIEIPALLPQNIGVQHIEETKELTASHIDQTNLRTDETGEKVHEEPSVKNPNREEASTVDATEERVIEEIVTEDNDDKEKVDVAGSIEKDNNDDKAEEEIIDEKVVESKVPEDKVTVEKITECKVDKYQSKEDKIKINEDKTNAEEVNQQNDSCRNRHETKIEEKVPRPRRATRGKKSEDNIAEESTSIQVSEPPKSDLTTSVKQTTSALTESNPCDGDSPAEKMDVDKVQKTEQHEMQSRSLRPRSSLKRSHDEPNPEEGSPKVEPPRKQLKTQLKKTRGSTHEQTPMIKLPNFRSRTTISASNPISRLDTKYEPASVGAMKQESEKKFVCHQCGYATDRLNNLVYHSTKAFCTGKCQIGEVMKANIIKQQQQAKNKRRSVR